MLQVPHELDASLLDTPGFNYPKATDQSILTNGHMIDKQLCKGFDSQGYDTGLPGSFVNGVDYNNAFVGHYEVSPTSVSVQSS